MPEAVRNKPTLGMEPNNGTSTSRRRQKSKFQHQRNAHGGCDAVLLIIFMVITPMLQNKVAVDMAKVDNPTAMPDADKEDAIVVAITKDGSVFLGQNKVAAMNSAAWFAPSWKAHPARPSMCARTRGRSTGE